MGKHFAEVIVDLPVVTEGRGYFYRIPAGLEDRVRLGVRVLVPFGRRKLNGYVVGVAATARVSEVKDILAVVDETPAFTPELYTVARWLSARYLCPMHEALAAVAAPAPVSHPRCREELLANRDLSDLVGTPKQRLVWETAVLRPGLTRSELAKAAGVSAGVVNSLISKGALAIRRVEPSQAVRDDGDTPQGPVLSPAQQDAASRIAAGISGRRKEVYLLYGVTGSGKTEVYFEAIRHCLELDRKALVLIPEITLTGQMVGRFRSRFGSKIAVLHSRLAAGVRAEEWQRAYRGEAKIVLGTRSAVFAPLDDIGLIVIDEEHEHSYKQDDNPKYHAREVALFRAEEHKAVLVLGSATPSLRTFAQALRGEHCNLLRLPQRVDGRPMPTVSVVDMREEHRAGVSGILSRPLAGKIAEKLSQGEQVILFLNRRGYSTVVVCRNCGQLMDCPHCAIGLTYHKSGFLRCHYCGFTRRPPEVCPGCGEADLGYFGTGTQRVEDDVQRLFPGARILRLDRDVTGRRGASDRILDAFGDRQADILVGTQMLAKGLDLPGVTLVGVINADTTLFLPDFRASERTFQLLEQVAGRSGRGDTAGEVVIQTYQPDHYSIVFAANHSFEEFFAREMNLRKRLGYPPFTSMARVLFRGSGEDQVKEAGVRFSGILEASTVETLGLAPAPLTKVRDAYRWHVILKAPSRMVLVRTLGAAQEQYYKKPVRGVSLSIDIDPQEMM